MKRRILILAYFLGFTALAANPAAARYASISIDAESGKVLHAVNPDTRNHPASLVKMMTLYVIFEALDSGKLKLDQMLPVSSLAAGRSPSKLGLKAGESISVRDIIGALVTKSANDAATVIAEALGGSVRNFARMMTKKGKTLGMTRTEFRNASGLPHYRQRSTARDMAKLAQALIRNFPNHYQQFAQQSFNFRGTTYRNHNRLLTRYEGMDGIKTGYIRASGFNLAASAERDGRRVITIVFGGKSPKWRDNHVARLTDKAFAALGPRPAETVVARRSSQRLPALIRPALAEKPVPAPATGETVADRGWAIQVGAYKRYAPARLAVTRAARAVPLLTTKQVTVVPDEGEVGRVYRARLVGLSESLARSSCVQLQQKKIACVVVPSDASLAQGSQ